MQVRVPAGHGVRTKRSIIHDVGGRCVLYHRFSPIKWFQMNEKILFATNRLFGRCRPQYAQVTSYQKTRGDISGSMFSIHASFSDTARKSSDWLDSEEGAEIFAEDVVKYVNGRA